MSELTEEQCKKILMVMALERPPEGMKSPEGLVDDLVAAHVVEGDAIPAANVTEAFIVRDEQWLDVVRPARATIEHLRDDLVTLKVSIATLEAELSRVRGELSSTKEVLERLPVSADGKPLMLGDDVFVNKALAEKYYDAGYGKRRPSDHHGEVFEVMVCGLGNLGDPNRRAGFLEPLMSFSISIDLRAVFSTREAALASSKSTADPSDKE